MANESADVMILGGGIIGLACAHALLKAGRAVTLVERERIGSGASHGNCGTITPSALPLAAPGVIAKSLKYLFKPDAPLRIAPQADLRLLRWLYAFARHCNERDFATALRVRGELLLLSRQLMGDLIRTERLECEFAEHGTLHLHRDARELERAVVNARLLAELGIAAQVLDGRAARAMEPALNDSVIGGQFFPGDATLRPDRLVLEMARIVRAAGGVIREQTAVLGFRSERGKVSGVLTSQGELRAGEFVLALGAWLPQVARDLRLRLPIEPGKGYSITYDGAAPTPQRALFLKECAVCITPWRSGIRLGSTLEFAGYDGSLNQTRLNALVRGAEQYLHFAPSAHVQEQWFGWRPMTPDDLPILGRAPGWSNLTLATGHGMLGVSLAPVTGLVTAELLAGRASPVNLEPFSAARFAH